MCYHVIIHALIQPIDSFIVVLTEACPTLTAITMPDMSGELIALLEAMHICGICCAFAC